MLWPVYIARDVRTEPLRRDARVTPVGVLNALDWHTSRHCQTNLYRPAKGDGLRDSSRQLTPLRHCGGTIMFEDISAIEVAVMIEIIVYRGVSRSEPLQGFDILEPSHRALSSSKRLV